LTVTFETSGQHPGVNNKHTPFFVGMGYQDGFQTTLELSHRFDSGESATIRWNHHTLVAYIPFAVLGYIHCGHNTALTLVNPFFTKFLICGFFTARPSDLLATITLVMRALLKNIVYKGYI
jgi:hypothetical protein